MKIIFTVFFIMLFGGCATNNSMNLSDSVEIIEVGIFKHSIIGKVKDIQSVHGRTAVSLEGSVLKRGLNVEPRLGESIGIKYRYVGTR